MIYQPKEHPLHTKRARALTYVHAQAEKTFFPLQFNQNYFFLYVLGGLIVSTIDFGEKFFRKYLSNKHL